MSKFLCKVGIHRWKWLAPALGGTGCAEECKGCGWQRITSFFGAYFYGPKP